MKAKEKKRLTRTLICGMERQGSGPREIGTLKVSSKTWIGPRGGLEGRSRTWLMARVQKKNRESVQVGMEKKRTK